MTYDALILDMDGVIVTPTGDAIWHAVNRLAAIAAAFEPTVTSDGRARFSAGPPG